MSYMPLVIQLILKDPFFGKFNFFPMQAETRVLCRKGIAIVKCSGWIQVERIICKRLQDTFQFPLMELWTQVPF